MKKSNKKINNADDAISKMEKEERLKSKQLEGLRRMVEKIKNLPENK